MKTIVKRHTRKVHGHKVIVKKHSRDVKRKAIRGFNPDKYVDREVRQINEQDYLDLLKERDNLKYNPDDWYGWDKWSNHKELFERYNDKLSSYDKIRAENKRKSSRVWLPSIQTAEYESQKLFKKSYFDLNKKEQLLLENYINEKNNQ